MKNRWNIALFSIWLVSAVICVINWLTFLDVPSFLLPIIPSFCSQWFLCRITKNGYLRALPVLPVVALLAIAGWYAVFGSGWDMLAAILFAFAAIAPAVGVALGWLVWWLIERRKRNLSTKEC